jgi:hypothetical protein
MRLLRRSSRSSRRPEALGERDEEAEGTAARTTAEAENARHTRYKRCAGFRPGRVGSRSCKSVRTRPRISAAAPDAQPPPLFPPAASQPKLTPGSKQRPRNRNPARAQGDNDGRPASEIERLVDVSDTAVCSEHPPAPTQVVPERRGSRPPAGSRLTPSPPWSASGGGAARRRAAPRRTARGSGCSSGRSARRRRRSCSRRSSAPSYPKSETLEAIDDRGSRVLVGEDR